MPRDLNPAFSAKAFEFELLVRDLLVFAGANSANELSVELHDGYDLLIRNGSRAVVVTIKFFRSEFLEMQRLEAALGEAVRTADGYPGSIPALVVSAKVGGEVIRHWRSLGLVILDGVALASLAMGTRSMGLHALFNALPYEVKPADVENVMTSIDDVLLGIDSSRLRPDAGRRRTDSVGKSLCSELHGIPGGKSHAKTYEIHVQKILTYLFQGQLEGFRAQSRTVDGMSILDMVCRIKHSEGFWQFVAVERSSRYVVFECKNYRGAIGQDQVHSTEKYLLLGANRSVGFIVSRKPPSAHARRMAEGAIREHGKLILFLADEDLCRMLDMTDAGLDPSDHLFELADTTLMTLGCWIALRSDPRFPSNTDPLCV